MYLDSVVSEAGKIIDSRGHSGYSILPDIIELIDSRELALKEMTTLLQG